MHRRSRLWYWLLARLGTLGWGTLLAGALLALFEWSGMGTRWVHGILSARLAALGGELHLGAADFQWLEPGLVLEELSLVTDEEILSAEHLHVRFGWEGGLALVPTRVHLRGARVVLDPTLADGVRGLLNIPDKNLRALRENAGLPKLPNVLIEDLTVLVETSISEQVEVLHVDLSLDATADRPRVVGRVQTPRQRAQGAPGSIRLSGGVNAEGVLDIRGQALGLEITPDDVPDAPELEPIRAWQPRGILDLEARVIVDLLNDQTPRAEFTGRLERASLLPPGAQRTVDELELIYTLKFDPEREEWLWDTSAWEGVAHAKGEFAEETFTAGFLIGDSARNDAHFEAWLNLDDVDIAAPLDELLPEARWVDELHIGAAPTGAFSAKICTRLPRLPAGERGPLTRPEMLVHINVEPGTRLTYHGWPARNPEHEPVGFPVPASVQAGEIIYAYTRRLPRRGLMQISLDLEHASGSTEVNYLNWSAPVDTPPFASGVEEHLSINVPRLDVNEELEHAMTGLDPILGEGTIWRQYAPTGGFIGVALHLTRLPGSRTPDVRLDVDVMKVGCTVATFPVPVSAATGQIQVVSQHDGELGSSWDLTGSSGTTQFHASGRARSRKGEGGERERLLSTLEVQADHVDVNGPVHDVLEESTREILATLNIEGSVRARLETYATGALRRGLELELEPGSSAAPEYFPEPAGELAGTLRLAWNEANSGEEIDMKAWVPCIEGSGPADEHISFTGAGTQAGWSGSLLATGLATSMGVAEDGLATVASENTELSLRGVVDLEAQLKRSAPSDEDAVDLSEGEDPGDDWTSKLEVVLRSNTLTDAGTPLLEELEGTFNLEDGHITAPLISGRLEDTEVFLEDLDLRNDDEALTLSTKIRASGIPLDTEHMDALFDEEVLMSLVEELGLRGSIDVEHGVLEMSAPRTGDRSVRFSGSIAIGNAALQAGLPIVIQSARAHIYDLILENGELRGWGRVEDLYGNCFESELGPVRALVSYVDGIVAIEDFSGSFERGLIRPLDRDSDPRHPVRGRPALTIGLRPPYPYHASVAVENLDASRWLEGLSSDAMTGSGILSVEVDLMGTLGELVETRGSGTIKLVRSRLWSIPLFRELLREFGLDHTVMFDEVRFDFGIADEVITMEKLQLRSPLLKLVGNGTLDMEGRLHHDLEVHYSIVDKIAPFRRLFYLVQNVFVSVSIRGDLSRPVILLNNGLLSLFRDEPEIVPSLPLPGLSPLPRRF